MSRFRMGQEVIARNTIETQAARVPMGQIGMVIAIEAELDAVRVKFRTIEPDLRVADSDLVELEPCKDTLVRELVALGVNTGAQAMSIMLIELEERAKTPEVMDAVHRASRSWLEFNRALNEAMKAIRDQPKEKT
jgi:hypothetical protein